jgi:predicted MFS family arabinose efflux permease
VVFAVILIGRPLGAVIFGHFGDRLGRRRTTLVSVAGFTVVTLLIALLPGYNIRPGVGSRSQRWLCCGFSTAFSSAAKYTAANPLAMEYAPKNKRGFYGALIHVGYPAALLCASALTAIMLAVAPGSDAASPYATWGWRIPFLISAVLSGTLFLYYYWLVPESDLWRSAAKSAAPLKELFSGAGLRRVGELFVVMTGAWLTLNATVGALPGVINAVLDVKLSGVNTGILIGAGISAVLYPFMGMLSQQFGRRPTIAVIGLLNLIPACAFYYTLAASGYRDPTALVVLVTLIMVLSLPIWAVHTPCLAEGFRTGIRSSGYGVSYSLVTIIPGLYSFYMLGLGTLVPYACTPIVFVALGGLCLTTGVLAGQEIRDVDFHGHDEPGMT